MATDGGPSTDLRPTLSGVPPWLSRNERYRRAIDAHRQALALARSSLGDDVPIIQFWQPVVFTRRPTEDERSTIARDGMDSRSFTTFTGIFEGVRQLLPPGVIDLGDLFDGSPTVFVDPVHTNELGADLVARAMYEHAKPTIEALRG